MRAPSGNWWRLAQNSWAEPALLQALRISHPADGSRPADARRVQDGVGGRRTAPSDHLDELEAVRNVGFLRRLTPYAFCISAGGRDSNPHALSSTGT